LIEQLVDLGNETKALISKTLNRYSFISLSEVLCTPPIIDPVLCKGCNRCVDLCPEDVLEASSEKDGTPVVRYPDECWHCGVCMIECPEKAITKFHIPLPMRISVIRGGR